MAVTVESSCIINPALIFVKYITHAAKVSNAIPNKSVVFFITADLLINLIKYMILIIIARTSILRLIV